MDRSKVFLSSSQFTEEFIVERESLPLLFNKDPLKEKFLLWRIEDFASPDQITQHFLQNVESCDIFLLLIGKEFRKAVYEEYKSAYAHKKQIFCFIKHYDNRAEQVVKFIREVQGSVTTTDYHDLQQLSKKIEESFVNYFFIDGPAKMSIMFPARRSFRNLSEAISSP
jgi:hypothetical protein